MEILLIILIVLMIVLMGGMGYLLWLLTKPKLEVPIPKPEKAFDDFKKLYDDSDPRAKERLEQMSKCIFYSSELEDKVNTYGN